MYKSHVGKHQDPTRTTPRAISPTEDPMQWSCSMSPEEKGSPSLGKEVSIKSKTFVLVLALLAVSLCGVQLVHAQSLSLYDRFTSPY